ncbi:MAG: tRNA (adenosine(37)-N6)-dimethylallyltransferase MiaA [Christensenellales bacterium]|jgi:tRNA dimethylallyltransferase
MDNRIFLPVVTGATATGKTACAIELCRMIGGEVVSADSMQLFRGMEILSAVPSAREQRGIAHHMVGIAPPSAAFSAATYRDMAAKAIAEILARKKQPVLCGGTGLYIDAVTKPMRFSDKSDQVLREELHAIAGAPDGRERLHAQLRAVDPESAMRLHPNDVRRVARAIEVYRLTGITLTEHNRRDAARKGEYNERIFALDIPREQLYARIDRRVDEMIEHGLLDEVRALMQLSEDHPTAIQAIGYKEIASALRGEMPLSEAIVQMKQATRNYAKRQLTWLKRDARVIWIDASECSASDAARIIYEKIMEDTL